MLCVMGYSRWQVRRQRCRHVDSSGRGERRSLNRFLLLLFAVATLATWAWASREFALGLALSALLVAAAMLSARWCKLSLHVAFAMRSEEHTSELQSLMSISYAVFCSKKNNMSRYTHITYY